VLVVAVAGQATRLVQLLGTAVLAVGARVPTQTPLTRSLERLTLVVAAVGAAAQQRLGVLVQQVDLAW